MIHQNMVHNSLNEINILILDYLFVLKLQPYLNDCYDTQVAPLVIIINNSQTYRVLLLTL